MDLDKLPMDAYPVQPAEPIITATKVEAEQALTHAKERKAQADALTEQAQRMMDEAAAAKVAAQTAQEEAEIMARKAHYASVSVHKMTNAGAQCTSPNAGATEVSSPTRLAICGKLSISMEELRVAETLKADRRELGVDGAQGLSYLLAGCAMPRLEVLTLSCNSLGEVGVATVADALNPSIPLRQLDLSSNSVRELGVAAIARAMERGALPHLAKLALKNNDINDEGAAALAAAPHDALEWLNLSGNQIGEMGAIALAASLTGFKRLRRLSLDHNLLNDGAMLSLEAALDRSAALEEVYVSCNPASEEAIQRVEEYFVRGDAAAKNAPPRGSNACEMISLSIQESFCVCQ